MRDCTQDACQVAENSGTSEMLASSLTSDAVAAVKVVKSASNVEKELVDSDLRERISSGQKSDDDIGVVLSCLLANEVKPTWDEIAGWSAGSKALWSQWERLSIADGLLYRSFEDLNSEEIWRQVIIPRALRSDFVQVVHTGVGLSHVGRSRTELAVKRRAYWVGWTADVRRVLSSCEKCVRYKRGKIPPRTPLQPILCGEPREIVSIDITGPHPTSRDGFNWILTVQDHMSKWTEA